MSVILIMLPLALLLAAVGVGAFLWATRNGQFEDLDTPPVRAVFDDEFAADAAPHADERSGAAADRSSN